MKNDKLNIIKLVMAISLFILSLSVYSQHQPGSMLGGHRPTEFVNESKTVKLFPNPVTEFLFVRYEAPHSTVTSLKVLNVLGSVMTAEVEVVNDFEAKLNLTHFAPGIYLLATHDERTGTKSVHKFIKK